MKKEKGLLLKWVCVALGVALLAGSVAALALWNWDMNHSEKQAASYVQTLQTLIPQPRDAVPEARRDNAMPSLSVDGTDFVGILEMPRYQSVLPVGASWGKSQAYPCRFDGSIYDGTMQIGATTQKGQYDFYRELSVGDTVFFTDMEGNRYTYEITALRNEAHADQAALQQQAAALTLFVKNIYSFEYLIIFCNTAG